MSKKYKKMMKTYKKKLVKNAKDTRPWDFKWLLDAVILNIQYMYDYYDLGENVMAKDDCEWNPYKKDMPTRKEMCARILRAYNSWQNYQTDLYGGDDQTNFGIIKPVLDDLDANDVLLSESYDTKKEQFFETLSKYLDDLWD